MGLSFRPISPVNPMHCPVFLFDAQGHIAAQNMACIPDTAPQHRDEYASTDCRGCLRSSASGSGHPSGCRGVHEPCFFSLFYAGDDSTWHPAPGSWHLSSNMRVHNDWVVYVLHRYSRETRPVQFGQPAAVINMHTREQHTIDLPGDQTSRIH